MRLRVIKNGKPLDMSDRNTIRMAYQQGKVEPEKYMLSHLYRFSKVEGNDIYIGCEREGCYTYSEYMNI